MKNVMKTVVMCTALVMALTACGQKDENGKTDQKVKVSANESMSSDQLTQAGEQLITPYTFHLADRAFVMALEKDPNNKKAQFYRAFLKRFMVTRGILNRVRTYAQNYGKPEELAKTIRAVPKHPLKEFLLDDSGLKPIGDLDGIQQFLTEYRNALSEFRSFVSKNPNLEFEVYLNPYLFDREIRQNLQDSCVALQNTETGFEVECRTESIALVKVNIADLLVLKQMVAGEQLYMTLMTSYSMKGLEGYFQEREASKKEVCTEHTYDGWDHAAQTSVPMTYLDCQTVYPEETNQELWAKITQPKSALVLRADNGMKEVKNLGADFAAAAKWALRYQRELCKAGYETKQNRPGFLFSEGLCVEDANEAKNALALFDKILQGAVQMDVTSGEGELVKTDVNLFAPFVNPIKDIRSVMPSAWNSCGEAIALKDRTLGGLYPRGDGELILAKNTGCR